MTQIYAILGATKLIVSLPKCSNDKNLSTQQLHNYIERKIIDIPQY